MKVLSLFDGISAGRLALERSGVEVEKYYRSEIDTIKYEADNYKEALSVVNYGLYFKAVTAAQNWINQAKRKKRK